MQTTNIKRHINTFFFKCKNCRKVEKIQQQKPTGIRAAALLTMQDLDELLGCDYPVSCSRIAALRLSRLVGEVRRVCRAQLGMLCR